MRYINLIISISVLLASCKMGHTPKDVNLGFPYEKGKEYLFKYYYADTSGAKFIYSFLKPLDWQKDGSHNYSWGLEESSNKDAVNEFSFIILGGKVNEHQIVLQYKFYSNNRVVSESVTGLIQTKEEIWMHPPRTKGFRILELNPFPHIKYPLKKNNIWNEKLIIGNQWGDKRWKTWVGNVQFDIAYKNNGFKTIPTKLGSLQCYEIEAVGKSKLGTTKLLCYFNRKYGFVKFIYTNIDNTMMVIDLIEVSES